MANCISKARSNYFGVSDIEAFREELKELGIFPVEEDRHGIGISFLSEDGTKVGIALDDSCQYAVPDEEESCKTLEDVIIKYIAEGYACILTEVGYEENRYVYATSKVITARDIKRLDIDGFSLAAARELLGNPDWTTQMDY